MPRGGRRAGAPGKAYPNRADLSVNKGKVPNVPYPTGGDIGYGDQKQLMDAQDAVPVSSPAPPGPSAPPQAPPGLQGLMGGPGPAPGSLGAFDRDTERPNEPITHGLSTGPGGGPEVLSSITQQATTNLLKQIANSPYASQEIKALAARFG